MASFKARPAGLELDSDSDDDFFFSSYKEQPQLSPPSSGLSMSSDSAVSHDEGSFTSGPPPAKPPHQTSRSPFTKQNKPAAPRPRNEDGHPVSPDDLKVAVMRGDLNRVKELVQTGLDPDVVLSSKWTPLMYAAQGSHRTILDFLLEKGADPNFHKDHYSVLMCACSSQQSDQDMLPCIDLLLQKEVNVNTHDRYHMTAVMYAAREGKAGVVQRLMGQGAEVNKQDSRGWTALCWASSKGHKAAVQTLLAGRADPEKATIDGARPVDLASSRGFQEIVNLLVGDSRPSDPTSSGPVETGPVGARLVMTGPVVTGPEAAGPVNGGPVSSRPVMAWPSPARETSAMVNGVGNGPSGPALMLQQTDEELCSLVQQAGDSTRSYTRYGDLEMFLYGLQLGHLVPVFQEHAVTFADLLKIKAEELDKMGIRQVGVQKTLLAAVRDVHKRDWEKSSLPRPQGKAGIRCDEAVAMLSNITRHVSYIASTVAYIHEELDDKPHLMDPRENENSVQCLSEQTSDVLETVRGLHEELRSLKTRLIQMTNSSDVVPADLVLDPYTDQQGSGTVGLVLTLAAAGALVGLYCRKFW
ncbi:ankyrin repeat, SAM and basic leucine zipper domain-containing protein 1-like [Branchiostoma floridae x Branchiostoma japonicum]